MDQNRVHVVQKGIFYQRRWKDAVQIKNQQAVIILEVKIIPAITELISIKLLDSSQADEHLVIFVCGIVNGFIPSWEYIEPLQYAKTVKIREQKKTKLPMPC